MNVERQPIMFLLMRRIFAYKASSVCVGLWACLVWSFICVIGNKDKVTFFFFNLFGPPSNNGPWVTQKYVVLSCSGSLSIPVIV